MAGTGNENGGNENMLYQDAYNAYMAAQRELYASRRKREELSKQREESILNEQTYQQAGELFRQRQQALAGQRRSYVDALEKEKRDMSRNIVPKAEIQREAYLTEEKPLLEEDIEKMAPLEETNPAEYKRYTNEVEKVMSAEQWRRTTGQSKKKPWETKGSPFDHYQKLKEEMKRAESDYDALVAQRQYPEKIASAEEVRPEAVEKVNKLLASQNLGSLEELQKQKRELDSLRGECDRQLAGVSLSKELTSRKAIAERDPDLVGIMKEKLDEAIRQQSNRREKLGNIDSVDALFQEEEELEQAKKKWENDKSNPDLKLLYEGFEFRKLGKEDASRRQKLEAEIDRMIEAYPQEPNTKPVSSIGEYYASISREQEKIEEIHKLEKEGVKTRKAELTEILKQGKKWDEIDGLARGMEEYQAAVQEQASTRKLPETFRDLRTIRDENPVLYREIREQINHILEAHKDDKTKPIVHSLNAYFSLDQRAGELEQKAKDAEKQKANDAAKVRENNALRTKATERRQKQEDAKTQIKRWIREYNKDKGKAIDLKEADEKLVDIVKKHNEAKKKEAGDRLKQMKGELKNLQEGRESQRRFIKYEVIQKAGENRKKEIEKLENIHKSHVNAVASIIDAYNSTHAREGKALSSTDSAIVKRLKQADEAYKNRLAKINKALKKAGEEEAKRHKEWAREKENYDKMMHDYRTAINSRQKEIKDLLHKENEKIAAQNKQIQKMSKQVDRSFDGYDQHANEEVEKFRKDRLSESKSSYRKAAAKKKVMSALSATLSTVSKTLETVMLTATEAAIRGEEQTLREEITKIQDQLNNTGAANLRVLNTSAKLRENLNNEASQSSKPVRRNLNELAASENASRDVANGLQEYSNQLAADLNRLNGQLEEVMANQPERLQKNRDSITDIFKERAVIDGEGQRRVETAVYAIDREAAAGDAAKEALAQVRYDARMEHLDELIQEDARTSAQVREQLEELESVSKKLQGLFTEGKLDTIDKVVKVGQVVANFVIDRMNNLKGESSSTEHVDIQQTLKSLEESLTDDEPKEHTVETLLKIGKLAYGKIREIDETVSAQNSQAASELDVAETGYEKLLAEEKDFEDFIKQMPPEDLGSNLLEQWNAFYDKSAEKTIQMLDRDIQDAKAGEVRAAARKDEAASATAVLQENLSDQDEQIKADKAALSDQKAKLKTAFATDIKGNGKNDPVELSYQDIFAEPVGEDFTFLSKLTGVQMSEGMDVDAAMNAFGRIYINGINAVSYFDLADRWQEASFGDPASPENQEARSKLVRGLTYFGKEIQSALKAPFGSQEKNRLTGQMIAVENESLTLSPVTLSAQVQKGTANASVTVNTEAISQFNRTSAMISDSFNEVRLAAAEAQRRLDVNPDRRKRNLLAEDLKDEKDRQEWRDRRLAKAVHRSRNTQKNFQTKDRQQADNQPQKSSQPMTRR